MDQDEDLLMAEAVDTANKILMEQDAPRQIHQPQPDMQAHPHHQAMQQQMSEPAEEPDMDSSREEKPLPQEEEEEEEGAQHHPEAGSDDEDVKHPMPQPPQSESIECQPSMTLVLAAAMAEEPHLFPPQPKQRRLRPLRPKPMPKSEPTPETPSLPVRLGGRPKRKAPPPHKVRGVGSGGSQNRITTYSLAFRGSYQRIRRLGDAIERWRNHFLNLHPYPRQTLTNLELLEGLLKLAKQANGGDAMPDSKDWGSGEVKTPAERKKRRKLPKSEKTWEDEMEEEEERNLEEMERIAREERAAAAALKSSSIKVKQEVKEDDDDDDDDDDHDHDNDRNDDDDDDHDSSYLLPKKEAMIKEECLDQSDGADLPSVLTAELEHRLRTLLEPEPGQSETDFVGMYECDFCGLEFMRQRPHHIRGHLEAHMLTKSTESKSMNVETTCQRCEHSRFPDFNALRAHVLQKHGHTYRICRLCHHVCKTRIFHRRHVFRIHFSKPYSCNQCGQTVTDSVEKKHNCVPVPTTCHLCGFVCNKRNINKHMTSVHSDVKKFVCDECGKRFKKPGHLRNHKPLHWAVKPYHCTFCQFTCVQRGNLRGHIARSHNIDLAEAKKYIKFVG